MLGHVRGIGGRLFDWPMPGNWLWKHHIMGADVEHKGQHHHMERAQNARLPRNSTKLIKWTPVQTALDNSSWSVTGTKPQVYQNTSIFYSQLQFDTKKQAFWPFCSSSLQMSTGHWTCSLVRSWGTLDRDCLPGWGYADVDCWCFIKDNVLPTI